MPIRIDPIQCSANPKQTVTRLPMPLHPIAFGYAFINDRTQPIVIRANCTVHRLAVASLIIHRPEAVCRSHAQPPEFIDFHIQKTAIDFIFAMRAIILVYLVRRIYISMWPLMIAILSIGHNVVVTFVQQIIRPAILLRCQAKLIATSKSELIF